MAGIETPEYVKGYNSGLKECAKHQVEPSVGTKHLFERMQKQIDYIVKTVDSIKEDNKEGHGNILEHQKKTNGKVMKNTEFRLKNEDVICKIDGLVTDFTLFKGGFNTLKWIASLVGLSNLATVLYFFISK